MKIAKRLTAILLSAILTVLLFAGCAQNEAPAASASPPAPTASPVPTASAPASEPAAPTTRTITDMAGRTVTLPVEINTIGTFGSIGVLNAFVETMGAGHKICNEGSASFVRSPSWEKYQYKFTPQIKGMQEFESADRELIMENILAVSPDLCLSMSKNTTEALEAQGLNVVHLEWAKDEDIATCINLLGEILNAPDVAADYLKYFNDMVAKADALTDKIPETERKNVLYGAVSTMSQPHVIAEWWIQKAGGISVTSDALIAAGGESLTYTLEDLLLWNPDVMFISSANDREAILADERLADINAVKNDEIYALPRIAHTWGNRTTEQPLTIMWAINKLYPEILSDKELQDDIFYFYSHFFGTDFTSDELAEISKG